MTTPPPITPEEEVRLLQLLHHYFTPIEDDITNERNVAINVPFRVKHRLVQIRDYLKQAWGRSRLSIGMTLFLYMKMATGTVDQALTAAANNDQLRRVVTATKQTRADVEHLCNHYARCIRMVLTPELYYQWQWHLCNQNQAVYNLHTSHRWKRHSTGDLEILNTLLAGWVAAEGNGMSETRAERVRHYMARYQQVAVLEDALAEDRVNTFRELIEIANGMHPPPAGQANGT